MISLCGDGTAVLTYTYVDNLVDGVHVLMHSDLAGPTIVVDQHGTVEELVRTVIDVSRKENQVEHVEGPVGEQARNLDDSKIKSLGGEATASLRKGDYADVYLG